MTGCTNHDGLDVIQIFAYNKCIQTWAAKSDYLNISNSFTATVSKEIMKQRRFSWKAIWNYTTVPKQEAECVVGSIKQAIIKYILMVEKLWPYFFSLCGTDIVQWALQIYSFPYY